ncbi:MAG: CBS domain-containing protein [Candidatus Thiodiazotropha sp. (ex Dulcina madagascariensis)]|nr:CBS domain-containing protein [Candidatus Thiodiazotropha sp. (ex Epidulcina cf. delphinae)]MCU7921211.1 CBS domain-containing protein [Candidatus Thiodiazotropha sp. (ex Dulcina madagascariensis)]MCU7925740.1 CBS domain-containing protein [Candidatus Thiodiazotropha sp. (ex Dulcina madagascariensis)]
MANEQHGMELSGILIETECASPGMMVRDVFLECGRAKVHALPYRDEKGRLCGRVTLKNIMKLACLPEYMVELAPLLGQRLSCVEHAEDKVRQVLCETVDDYVLELSETIASDAPLIRALATMEKNDTSYIFVVDDGVYRGIVTIQGIAARMSEYAVCVGDKGDR